MSSGLLPVGRPSTNGWSSVGMNDLMRPDLSVSMRTLWFLRVDQQHTDDIVGNIFRHIPGIFSNDDPPCKAAQVSVFHCLEDAGKQAN